VTDVDGITSLEINLWVNTNWNKEKSLGKGKGSNNETMSYGVVNFSVGGNGLNQYGSWSPSVIYHDDNYPGMGPGGNGVTMADGYVTASYNALNQPVVVWKALNEPYGGAPAAVDIANAQAASMVGQRIPAAAASAQMNAALAPLATLTMQESRQARDVRSLEHKN
jgi:hypothetical protein